MIKATSGARWEFNNRGVLVEYTVAVRKHDVQVRGNVRIGQLRLQGATVILAELKPR